MGMRLGTEWGTGVWKVGHVVGQLLRRLLGLGVAMPGHVAVVGKRLGWSDTTTSQGKRIPIPASLHSRAHVPIDRCTGMRTVELGTKLGRRRMVGPVAPHGMVLGAK